MRSFEEITADMRVGHTFSSMSDFEHWAMTWCDRCRHEDGCPVMDAALINNGFIPTEWTRPALTSEPFRCTAFTPRVVPT